VKQPKLSKAPPYSRQVRVTPKKTRKREQHTKSGKISPSRKHLSKYLSQPNMKKLEIGNVFLRTERTESGRLGEMTIQSSAFEY